ncbi:MAG: ketoacyl-ACP synthase III family protein [Pseudonocardiaceae bacterium]|nr:ketoacyl-ACP synthase III family protein [Pseudonocardiaceae bacterium]
MHLCEDLGLVAAVWYPADRQTTAEAIAAGDVDRKTANRLGYLELPVSTDVAPPDMAVAAGREALARARVPAEQVSMVLHASVHHQGHDAWSAPHYVANELGTDRAVPIGLLQQCNGGAIGIELAATRLQADSKAGPVLVTTADRFHMPSWHRWRTDYGMAAGDAATAVLVQRPDADQPPDLILHSIATTVASELEVMHRGVDGFSSNPLDHSAMISVKRTKRAFIERYGVDMFVKTAYDRIGAAVTASLTEAGLAPDSPRLRYAVLPRLGADAMTEAYIPPLRAATQAELLDLGRRSGHIGAGDLNANIAELAASGLLAPGECAVILNGGGGFTFTSIVVSAPLTA